MKVRKTFYLLMLFVMIFSIAEVKANNKEPKPILSKTYVKKSSSFDNFKKINTEYLLSSNINYFKVDCSINISIEREDGSKIEGKVTFKDVTVWQCFKIKVGKLWNDVFN